MIERIGYILASEAFGDSQHADAEVFVNGRCVRFVRPCRLETSQHTPGRTTC
jgi:hypothetical protein